MLSHTLFLSRDLLGQWEKRTTFSDFIWSQMAAILNSVVIFPSSEKVMLVSVCALDLWNFFFTIMKFFFSFLSYTPHTPPLCRRGVHMYPKPFCLKFQPGLLGFRILWKFLWRNFFRVKFSRVFFVFVCVSVWIWNLFSFLTKITNSLNWNPAFSRQPPFWCYRFRFPGHSVLCEWSWKSVGPCSYNWNGPCTRSSREPLELAWLGATHILARREAERSPAPPENQALDTMRVCGVSLGECRLKLALMPGKPLADFSIF